MSNYSNSEYNEENKNSSWYKVYKLIKHKDRVLDVGCSSGNFGAVLHSKKNCVVDGIEIDHNDYVKAKSKLRNVYKINVETDSLNDIQDKYDVIYFGDVIEHLVNPTSALKKVKKLLKKDGRIIFSIPNMAHISVRLMLMNGGFEYTKTGLLDNTHLHYYTLDEVYQVFSEAGLKINKIDFVEKDYPSDLIDKKLEEMGLSANNEFHKKAKLPDASAFQFIGEAITTNKKPNPRKKFGPIDLFETFHKNTVSSLENENKKLKSENTKLHEEKDKIQKELDELKLNLKLLKKHPIKFIKKRFIKK